MTKDAEERGALLALQVVSQANGSLEEAEARLAAIASSVEEMPDTEILYARALVSQARIVQENAAIDARTIDIGALRKARSD